MSGITYEYLQEHGFAKLKLSGARAATDPNAQPTAGSTVSEGHLSFPAKEFTPLTPSAVQTARMPEFRTLSGKIELYSEQAEKQGYDPLPGYVPPAESVEADPELAHEFPINLLSPAAHHFLNSTFSNVPSLQKGEKEPRIWVNPLDAEARGVADGEWLRVWNRRGEVRLRAVVSENVKPGVAWSPSLWWQRDSPGGNVNMLTSDRLADMGGGSTFHTNLIQFARLEESRHAPTAN